MSKKLTLLGSLFLLSVNVAGQVFAAAEKGLLMYLPFEGDTVNAVTDQGGEAKNVRFREGHEGQGAYFGVGSYLRFSPQGNINYREGTVEFWVKPDWNGDDGGYHYFFAGNITNARNVNSIHVSKKNYAGGIILGQVDSRANEKGEAIQEARVPGGKDLTPTSVADWRAGEWHHVAYSWDFINRRLKLYSDGLLRATTDAVNPDAFPSNYQSYINIGSSIDQVVFAEAVIDELKVWDHPRSDLEMAEAAGLTEFSKYHIQPASPLAEQEKSRVWKQIFSFFASVQQRLTWSISWLMRLNQSE